MFIISRSHSGEIMTEDAISDALLDELQDIRDGLTAVLYDTINDAVDDVTLQVMRKCIDRIDGIRFGTFTPKPEEKAPEDVPSDDEVSLSCSSQRGMMGGAPAEEGAKA